MKKTTTTTATTAGTTTATTAVKTATGKKETVTTATTAVKTATGKETTTTGKETVKETVKTTTGKETTTVKLYEFEIKTTNDLIKAFKLAGRDDVFNTTLPLKMLFKRASLKRFTDDWNTEFIKRKVFIKKISDEDLRKNRIELSLLDLEIKQTELLCIDSDNMESIDKDNTKLKDLKAVRKQVTEKVKEAEDIRHSVRVKELLGRFTWFRNEPVKATENEPVKATENEPVNEPEKEQVKATEKEPVKATEKEPVKK